MTKFYRIRGILVPIRCSSIESEKSVTTSLSLFAKHNRMLVVDKMMLKGILLKPSPKSRHGNEP